MSQTRMGFEMPPITNSDFLPARRIITPDYAPRPTLSWVRRHRRMLLACSLCIAILAAVYPFRDAVRRHVLWVYWSHRAAAHVMPEKPIALVLSSPAEISHARSAGLEYVMSRAYTSNAYYQPQSFLSLLKFEPRLKWVVNETQPVVFLGTRRRPDGLERWVIVTGGSGRWGRPFEYANIVVLPLPGWLDPLPAESPPLFGCGTRDIPAIWTELKSGVPDPADPSLIRFEVVARSASGGIGGGVIDAHLENDDSFTLKVRNSNGFPGEMLGGSSRIEGAPRQAMPDQVRQLRIPVDKPLG